jgi:hypothetical protein
VEGHVQDAQVSGQHVPFEHLDWHQQWILQQVTVEERGSAYSRALTPWGEQAGVGTHLYTMPWQTMTLPSSEPDANSGYRGWKATARRAFLWCLGEGCIYCGLRAGGRSPASHPLHHLPQHFVWLSGKIQIKPHQFAVIAATDDIVAYGQRKTGALTIPVVYTSPATCGVHTPTLTCRMHSQAGHPLAVGH